MVCKSYQTENGLPSHDAIRTWRAHNRGITHRKSEMKQASKLHAERFEHVETLKTAFMSIEKEHPYIFSHPNRLWNVDETEISAESEKPRKVFSSALSYHGGFTSQSSNGRSKHVTAVVAVSASGLMSPPFIIIEGKNIMSSWFSPFDYDDLKRKPEFAWLTETDWFPRDAVVMVSDNGSMEMRLIHHLIIHINRFVRKHIPANETYCLTLDRHSSRNGYAWLDICRKMKCEVLQLPSDTSHFLQPCDRKVNKVMKENVKLYREKLRKLRSINLNSVQTKMVLSVIGIRAVSSTDIQESFAQCPIWPMDYGFMEFCSGASRLTSKLNTTRMTTTRPSDFDTVQILRRFVWSDEHPSNILKMASELLNNTSTVHNILSKIGENDIVEPKTKKLNREILYKGTPAICLTLGEVIENRKRTVEEKKAKKIEEENRKAAKEAERAKKRALRTITGSFRGEKKQKVAAVEGQMRSDQITLLRFYRLAGIYVNIPTRIGCIKEMWLNLKVVPKLPC